MKMEEKKMLERDGREAQAGASGEGLLGPWKQQSKEGKHTEDGNLLSLHVTVEQRGLRLTAALTGPVLKWECNHSTARLKKNVIKFTGNWILDAELIWELTFSHSKSDYFLPREAVSA